MAIKTLRNPLYTCVDYCDEFLLLKSETWTPAEGNIAKDEGKPQ